jgi:hypothetical protein
VRRMPAALRYLTLHRLAFAVTALTVLVTASSTAATAVFATTAASLANRETLTDNPASSILVTAAVTPSRRATAAVTGAISASAAGLPITYVQAAQSNPLNLLDGIGGRQAQTVLLGLGAGQFQRHAKLVSGSWPGPAGGGSVRVCLPAAAAAALGVRPGGAVRVEDIVTHKVAAISVSCTFAARDPAAAFWLLNPLGAAAITRNGGFTTYGPMITAESPAGWPVPAANSQWLAVPDFAGLTARNLASLGTSLDLALSDFGSNSPLSPIITTNLPALLQDQAVTLEVARSQLLIWQLILLVIVGASLAVAVRLLAAQRAAEPSLLMARGATRRQLAVRGATDAAILAVPAALVGPVIGARVAPLIARLHLIGSGSVLFPASLPLTAWLAGIAVAAGCALIIWLPWLRTPLTPVQRRAGRARQRSIAILTSGADVALVLLAGGAAWQLAHYSAPVTTGVSGDIGVDPVLVAAPVLALTAGTLVMLRLLPLLIRLTERLAARGRGITVPTAAWMIGRRSMRQAGSALLTVLAVALTVVALAETASWRQSIHDQAGFSLGADTTVVLPPAAPLPLGQVSDITAARGVRAAVPVISVGDVLPNNAPATVLALDPRQARRVVPVRSDLLLKRFPDPLAALDATGAAAGEVLPGRPSELQVVASLSRAPVRQATLALQLTDADGIGYQVSVGTLPPDGTSRDFDVRLGAGAAYPLAVTGFSLSYQLPESGPSVPVTLTIGSVAGSGPHQPRRLAGALWPAGSTDRATVTGVDLSSEPRMPHPQQPTAQQPVRSGHGAVLRFDTGAGLSQEYPNPVTRTPSLTPAVAAINVTAAGPQVLPAVATSAFLAASGEHLGDEYQVTGLPTQVPVRIDAEISQFPTVTGTGGGIIISQAALQSFEEASGAGPVPVTQWWLRDSAPPHLSHLPAGAAVTTLAQVDTGLSSQPLTVAPVDALVAVSAIGLVLACFGFLVGVTASRERSRDLAVLDALGATPGQLTRLLCLEQGMLSVPAAAGGLALGLLLCRLIIPAVTLTAAAAHPVPAVIVEIPVAVAVAVAAAVAAVPIAAVALSIRRGSSTVARLRAEEET